VGYLKLLLDNELGPIAVPQAKALKAMDDCVQRLRRLIDSLLDVTGLETGRMQFIFREYDMVDVVHRSIARQSRAFEESGVQLVTDLPRMGSLSALGDPERLSRAIDHLLENAAKFTPAGGKVGVRLRRLESGHLELCVADSGPGVPQDKLERLFEPFYQVDGSPTRAHGGTGIGLAIVRGVARGHSGDVRVASPAQEEVIGVPLRGAAFYLVIAERAGRAPSGEYSAAIAPVRAQ